MALDHARQIHQTRRRFELAQLERKLGEFLVLLVRHDARVYLCSLGGLRRVSLGFTDEFFGVWVLRIEHLMQLVGHVVRDSENQLVFQFVYF